MAATKGRSIGSWVCGLLKVQAKRVTRFHSSGFQFACYGHRLKDFMAKFLNLKHLREKTPFGITVG